MRRAIVLAACVLALAAGADAIAQQKSSGPAGAIAHDYEAGMVASTPRTKDFHAWNDLRPPKPDFVYVKGEVEVPNPGVDAHLTYRVPQGVVGTTLVLDLHLHQRPGNHPQVMTWVPVRYDRELPAENYNKVLVHFQGKQILDLTVQDVH